MVKAHQTVARDYELALEILGNAIGKLHPNNQLVKNNLAASRRKSEWRKLIVQ